MKRSFLLLLIALCLANTGSAQALLFEKRYTPINETAFDEDHLVTADGGFALFFHTMHNTTFDEHVYLVKLNATGQIQWLRKWGGHSMSMGRLAQAPDSSFYFAMLLYDSTNTAYNITKVDPQGTILWSKRYDLPPGFQVSTELQCVATPDGGCAVAADLYDAATITFYWHLFKVDAGGNVVWSHRPLEAPLKTFHVDLEIGASGDFFMLGTAVDTAHVHAPLHVRLDPNGNLVHARTFFHVDEAYPYGMDVCADGGMISVSWMRDPATLYMSVLLLKTDASGALQWAKGYRHTTISNELDAEDVAQLPNGNYAVAGLINTLNMNGFLLGADSSGTVLWTNEYTDVALRDIDLPPAGGMSVFGHELPNFIPALLVVNNNGSNGCETPLPVITSTPALVVDTPNPSLPIALNATPLSWTQPFPDLPVTNICTTVGEEDAASFFDVRTFPVPAFTTLTVQSDRAVERAELMSITGETVSSSAPFASRFDIDVSQLPPGMYLLRLTTAEGTFTRKVMSGK